MPKINDESFFNHPLPSGYEGVVYDYSSSSETYILHAHNDIEINLILSGEAKLLYENEKYHLSQNLLLVLRPGEYHQIYDRSPHFAMKIIVFPPTFKERYSREERFHPFFLPSSTPVLRILSSDQMVRLLFLATEFQKEDISPVSANHILTTLFFVLSDFIPITNTPTRKGTLHPAVGKALKLIAEDGAHLSLNELASRVEIETETLCRLFKKEWGVGYNEYINNLRLENCKTMIQNNSGDVSLIDVALQSGFRSYRSFHRVFKAKFGLSPRDYI